MEEKPPHAPKKNTRRRTQTAKKEEELQLKTGKKTAAEENGISDRQPSSIFRLPLAARQENRAAK
jgi:hypothetical protein